MKSLVLLAVAAAAGYYYYLQHPTVADAFLRRSAPPAAVAAPTPRMHYHSPLDASNSHNSAGYYSNDPAEHYEVTGPHATTSTRHAPPSPVGEAP